MKKIEIEIPEGKCAKWVDGVLTLVDEKPQDITERIKTLEDAIKALGDNHPLVSQCYRAVAEFKYNPMTEDSLAYLKLRIIAAALNEGWEPTFDKDEERWYPWFKIKQGGLVGAGAGDAGSDSYACYGVRLVFKSKELAEYAGKQFTDIYNDFCYKTSNQEQ